MNLTYCHCCSLLDNNEFISGLPPEINDLKVISESQVDENQISSVALASSNRLSNAWYVLLLLLAIFLLHCVRGNWARNYDIVTVKCSSQFGFSSAYFMNLWSIIFASIGVQAMCFWYFYGKHTLYWKDWALLKGTTKPNGRQHMYGLWFNLTKGVITCGRKFILILTWVHEILELHK